MNKRRIIQKGKHDSIDAKFAPSYAPSVGMHGINSVGK